MNHYLVVMPYSWGRSDTLAAAERIARKEGGHGRRKVSKVVYTYDPAKTQNVYVNEYSQLCWTGECPVRQP